ncbi:MAG: HcpA family protein, partial [Verrucomicrobia bacterium]
MKRAFTFVWVALLLSTACLAQESTPASSPMEPQRPPAGARAPSTPAQAVVPVPVPIAPPKPNGP